MNRSLNFVNHKFISTTDQDRATKGILETLDEDKVLITNSFFIDFVTGSNVICRKGLCAIWIGHACDECGTCGLSNFSQVFLLHSSDPNNSSFNEIFLCKIVDSHTGYDNVSASFHNHLNSVSQDRDLSKK